MAYMWKDFNIKTFPAETAVYKNGAFCPELSTIGGPDVTQNYRLPVHIIYIGEIVGERSLHIPITVPDQMVYLTVDISNKVPAKLNLFIRNAGENSQLRSHILVHNDNHFILNVKASHFVKNTGILVNAKLVAGRNSLSQLTGNAIIEPDATGAISDISFSALADRTARIEFLPAQHISSVPENAGHSASIFKPTDAQILYLRGAGLSGAEVNDALHDAFIHDFNLY